MKRIAQRDLSVNGSRVLSDQENSGAVVSAELAQANAHLQRLRAGDRRLEAKQIQPFNPLRIVQIAKNEAPATLAPQQPIPQPPAPRHNTYLKAHPSLLLGMLHRSAETTGRIWLLCKYLDDAGKGWLHVSELRAQLTSKSSELRVCGWRRLRQILAAGAGTFWQRDERNRLWLFGVGRVALALGVKQLVNRPIALPIHQLTQNIKHVRAHFYAAFHSGRADTETLSAPIARDTLEKLTHTSARTQRRYDGLLHIEKKSCFALGPIATSEAAREQCWQRGSATFNYVDRSGKFGSPGRTYLAWHLPNMYGGCHKRLLKGRQRKINRWLRAREDGVDSGRSQLASRAHPNTSDLVKHIRARGNGCDRSESKIERVFFASVKQAHQREKCRSGLLEQRDHYWPQPAGKGRAQVWLAVNSQPVERGCP